MLYPYWFKTGSVFQFLENPYYNWLRKLEHIFAAGVGVPYIDPKSPWVRIAALLLATCETMEDYFNLSVNE